MVDARNAETALRLCPFTADVADAGSFSEDTSLSWRRYTLDTQDDTLPLLAVDRATASKVFRWRIITAAETGARRRFQKYSLPTRSGDDRWPEQHGSQLNADHPGRCLHCDGDAEGHGRTRDSNRREFC